MPTTPDDDENEDIMTFDTALVTLRNGTGARREAWEAGHMLLFDASGPRLADETGAEWTPTTVDLFAEDWEVV